MSLPADVFPSSTGSANAGVTAQSRSALGKLVRITLQSAGLAAIWLVADFVARTFHLPVPGGVVGLLMLLALLFCGGVAPHWVKAGADWLLTDMLLFFIPATVAAVQYGGLFREDGWRLALVVVVGTLMVMVAVAFAVERASKFERWLELRRLTGARSARHAARA
ncbi:Holin-like protein CidA [Caballeronia sp. SBC1]|uniref:CidA/LrgA family protein n=1 Tax=Caballeronia sp. SBC1 TaxID=2705548 RepID=UPI00140A0552|nr:CidA/LrgA family protein [Caballeronia sp. SBC1]QIN63436.1 Holin-like protein CidA [Caballeronia sp. SBC1]